MKTIEIHDYDYERILEIHQKEIIEHGDDWKLSDTLATCLVLGIKNEEHLIELRERILK